MKNLVQNILRRLADLRFAILLLALLLICSIIGSIVEQSDINSSSLLQQNNIQGNQFFNPKNLLTILNFSHIFTSPWFLSLNLLLGLSLVICTLTQQLPSFDYCRSLNFLRLNSLPTTFDSKAKLASFLYPIVIRRLSETNYFLFQKNQFVYSFQGLIGRIGPVFVHISLILILIGSLLSACSGFVVQEFIPKGEITYLQNFSFIPFFTNFSVLPIRVNDFWISYEKQNVIHQFYTNLSLLNFSGNELEQFTLSVNHPFFKKDILWYQTDWDIVGLKFQVNNLFYQIPTTRLSISGHDFWVGWLQNNSQGELICFDNLRGDFFFSLASTQSKSATELFETLTTSSKEQLNFIDILTSTGLQIRYDPGIIFLSLGFAFLITSTFLSYLSYSRVWLMKSPTNLEIGGRTNRAKFNFELQLLKLFKF